MANCGLNPAASNVKEEQARGLLYYSNAIACRRFFDNGTQRQVCRMISSTMPPALSRLVGKLPQLVKLHQYRPA